MRYTAVVRPLRVVRPIATTLSDMGGGFDRVRKCAKRRVICLAILWVCGGIALGVANGTGAIDNGIVAMNFVH